MRMRRERLFGLPQNGALDSNAKARIIAYAKGYTALHRQPGQHRGPLTRAVMEVLDALLWHFHNSRTGACFPSYETISDAAQCSRDTVHRALQALEAAQVLTWVHRLQRVRVKVVGLLGTETVSKIVRTSNGYIFRDPLPCAASKSDYQSGTLLEDSLSKKMLKTIRMPDETANDPVESALARLGQRIKSKATLLNL